MSIISDERAEELLAFETTAKPLLYDAWRELENVLVSIYKLAPDKINNPVLNRLRDANHLDR